MVGLCGFFGGENKKITELVSKLQCTKNEDTTTYNDGNVTIGYVDHQLEFDKQPAKIGTNNRLLWCWGNIIGHQHHNNYQAKPLNKTGIEFCTSLYNKYGQNFVAGLNSEFSGIIYNLEAGSITFFTDRLGSRPIYYTRTDNGEIVFSSLLQSLQTHPSVDLEISREFVEEFFKYSRTFGIFTPVDGVYALPPASLVTFDTDGKHLHTKTYWWPKPVPNETSFDQFVELLGEIVGNAITERMHPTQRHGLLLSGGSDSRLVLNYLDDAAVGIHMNECLYANKEAETAQKVADCVGNQFVFFERDINYYSGVLDCVASSMNFNGRYEQSHAVGFAKEINNGADVLFTGQYSDTIAGGNYVPGRRRALGKLKHILPRTFPPNIDSAEQYVKLIQEGGIGGLNGEVPYFIEQRDIDPLIKHTELTSNGIQFHGVTYPTWDSLLQWGAVYPITNVATFQFYESLIHMMPTRYPFLDNRIIDLALETPLRYRWRDPAAAVLTNVNQELANIEHPAHNLGLNYSFHSRYYIEKAQKILNLVQNTGRDSGDDSFDHNTNPGGPWPNYDEVLRQTPLVHELIETHKHEIKRGDIVDYQAARQCYQDHMNNENKTRALFALATILGSEIF